MAAFGGKFQVQSFMRGLTLFRSSFGYLGPYLHPYFSICNWPVAGSIFAYEEQIVKDEGLESDLDSSLDLVLPKCVT